MITGSLLKKKIAITILLKISSWKKKRLEYWKKKRLEYIHSDVIFKSDFQKCSDQK